MIAATLVATGLLVGTWLVWTLPPPGGPSDRMRRVTVVVPARNEATRLPTLLRSLGDARGEHPFPVEVIVVDDESTDATPDVAAAHEATVVSAGVRPAGWLGKPWACQRGAEEASGDVLVFLDADVELMPGALGRLVGELDRRGGLVSVQPYHRTVRGYEQLSAYCNVVAVMGVGAFTPVRRVEPAGAFGPCLITSHADYRAVGGHAGVRASVVEDVHLARRYRAIGLPVTCRVGGDAVHFRMYPAGLGQLVEGWSKNIALGAIGTKRWAAAGATAWVASNAMVATAMVTSSARWIGGAAGVPWLALAGWVLVAFHLQWTLRRLGRFRWWTALVFAVPLAAFVAIFARSMWQALVRRRVRWSGRTIELGREGAGGLP